MTGVSRWRGSTRAPCWPAAEGPGGSFLPPARQPVPATGHWPGLEGAGGPLPSAVHVRRWRTGRQQQRAGCPLPAAVLRYTSPLEREPGVVAWLLNQSYAKLVEAEPELWGPERANWEQSDRAVFDHPDSVGACTFLSWAGVDLVGLFSFDPRPLPEYGVIGHNCILPDFRGRGLGKQQIAEALRLLRDRGAVAARVTTHEHPFFVPAQRMYEACGFREVSRAPWNRDLTQSLIHYELERWT